MFLEDGYRRIPDGGVDPAVIVEMGERVKQDRVSWFTEALRSYVQIHCDAGG